MQVELSTRAQQQLHQQLVGGHAESAARNLNLVLESLKGFHGEEPKESAGSLGSGSAEHVQRLTEHGCRAINAEIANRVKEMLAEALR